MTISSARTVCRRSTLRSGVLTEGDLTSVREMEIQATNQLVCGTDRHSWVAEDPPGLLIQGNDVLCFGVEYDDAYGGKCQSGLPGRLSPSIPFRICARSK